jgi:general secretion pathway protein L
MRQHLRVALPPLTQLVRDSILPFVQVDTQGGVARAGHVPLAELGGQSGSEPVYAILHPDDAIVANTTLPPVSARHLDAAVSASIEPMTLSDIDELCVAHGPRAQDGTVTVAWTARRPLEDAWALLVAVGVNVVAFIPHALAIPDTDPQPDRPLELPAGPRWLAPLPAWSLARSAARPPSTRSHWRRPLYWVAAAVVVWVVGLNVYAARLGHQVEALQHDMRLAVMQAFPQVQVVIDPVRQAQHQRDALRRLQGDAVDDDFVPLALAAASVLDFSERRVRALHYTQGVLTLTLAEGYAPPANEAALAQSASVRQLKLEREDSQPHVWRVQRQAPGESRGAQP